MLKKLEIKNYAIIEHLDILFDEGLTIITGETGAGKSILLGALGLIMGKRADTKILYEKEQKAVVEATFHIKEYDLREWFDQHDIDYTDELTIRRIISPSGKSRAFVNDEPTNLSKLKELTDFLVDMHQQFDTLDIHNVSFQTNTVDILAGNESLMEQYTDQYKIYLRHKRNLEQLRERQSNAQNEMDFLNFQMSEFESLALVGGEQIEKEQQLNRLNSAEDIQRTCQQLSHLIESSESNILDLLRPLINDLDRIKDTDSALGSLSERLHSVVEELNDLSKDAERIAEDTEYNPEAIDQLNERLSAIYKMQQKHNVQTLDDLLEVQARIEQDLKGFGDLTDEISQVEKNIEKLEKVLTAEAKTIAQKREKIIPELEQKMQKMLASLSMENAFLKVQLDPTDGLSPSGLNKATFYFKANKGNDFQLLKDVASGGEIARLTLCLKSLVADYAVLPTLIFDEIDTGVSGDVAGKMGNILAQLSKGHQVISITHSPQIAARAHKHYFVYKEDRADRTITNIRSLDNDSRIQEIAKMLSGNPPSAAAIQNAQELIGS